MNDWQFLEPHPLAEIFPMLEEAQLNELAEDMARNGFDARYPIVLYGGKVLDGRNRLAAAVAARLYPGSNIHPAFVDYAGADPLAFVVRANLHRRHLGEGQRSVIAVELLPQLEAQARRDQIEAGSAYGERHPKQDREVQANLPEPLSVSQRAIAASEILEAIEEQAHLHPDEPIEKQKDDQAKQGKQSPPRPQSRDKAASLLGVSGRSVSTAKKLKIEAPDLLEEVRQGGKSLNKASSELNKRNRPQPGAAPPLPPGKFSVIYADPPWLYDFDSNDDWANENHYPTLSVEELRAFAVEGRPVTDAFADDCTLFLWTTSPKLRDAFTVLEAWGFTSYKSSIVWVKNRNGAGRGWWGRIDHEFVLIATKGKVSPPPPALRFTSVLEVSKTKHSSKPAEIYARIEAMTPGATRLELFARGLPRENWTTWGNETEESNGS